MVKKKFDTPLTKAELTDARIFVEDASASGVTTIINVGTSLIESMNCIRLAQTYDTVYATVGIHPNDCTVDWKDDLKELKKYLDKKEENKIVAIGEIGLDKHYPDYNLQRQQDALKAQIELALEHNLAVVIHSRDAGEETLRSLEEFKDEIDRGIVHCFSEDLDFAQQVIEWGFTLGIGGTVTYLRNESLRQVVRTISQDSFVLETDAPFLPPQSMRGKQNKPQYIRLIAEYIAELRKESFETVAKHTTQTAGRIFNLELS